jgi:hypothetical protein
MSAHDEQPRFDVRVIEALDLRGKFRTLERESHEAVIELDAFLFGYRRTPSAPRKIDTPSDGG